jgi:glutaminyl-peptide cyclotransferase
MKNNQWKWWALGLVAAGGMAVLSSCGDKKKEAEAPAPKEERVVQVPYFSADSAYRFVEEQVNFGPRVPNTKAHRQAGDYLVAQLKDFGATVTEQAFESPSFDGQKLYLRNIIGSFFPEKTKRILLAAHWDTRPFADKDFENAHKPFDGANDGASGVGVLLEIARVLGSQASPEVGVDILFFDGEDWGERNDMGRVPTPEGLLSWWCLGSQYWAQNKHVKGYSAYYGILLDMVGAKGSQFHLEGYSMQYAPNIAEKVWNKAAQIGHSAYFVKRRQGEIIDDHYFVNRLAAIPMINIVHYDPVDGYFGNYHHTHRDNMEIISVETLRAVGETVLHVVYYED